jgi:transposase
MRVEILRSGGRRRHWSPEEKMRIVAETLGAGAKVLEVARKHAIAPSLIFAVFERAVTIYEMLHGLENRQRKSN